MSNGLVEGTLNNHRMEDMLRRAFLPVEPNARFIQTLRARLVRVSGGGLPSVGMAAVTIVAASLLWMASMSVGLRLLLAILGLVGLAQRRRRSRAASS